MDKFWQLLTESTIFQGIITLSVLLTWCYLIATGQQPPETLNNIVGLVVGFFFGGKMVAAAKSKTKE